MKRHILILALLTCSIGLFAQTWTPSTGVLYADPTTTKVGIGLIDPLAALDVNGNILTSMTGYFGFRRERSGSTTTPVALISRQSDATTGYSDIQIGSGSGEYWHGLTDIYGAGYLGIRIKYNDNNGVNVGIGTTSPSSALEVVGNGLFSGSVSANGFVCNVAGGTTTYQKLVVNATSTNNYFDAALDINNTKLPIYFKWRGDAFTQSAMTIFGNGNIGIGTSDNLYKLSVAGGIGTSEGISLYGTGLDGSTYQQFKIAANTTYGNYLDAALDASSNRLPIYFKWRGDALAQSAMTILGNGNIGIGCSNPSVKLAVNGKIQATEVEIKSAPCSDYVFEKDYKLTSLSDLEKFVTANKHLPEVPSAKEFAEKGYSVGQLDDLLLRKVEELTLYVIDLKKENDALKQAVKSLK